MLLPPALRVAAHLWPQIRSQNASSQQSTSWQPTFKVSARCLHTFLGSHMPLPICHLNSSSDLTTIIGDCIEVDWDALQQDGILESSFLTLVLHIFREIFTFFKHLQSHLNIFHLDFISLFLRSILSSIWLKPGIWLTAYQHLIFTSLSNWKASHSGGLMCNLSAWDGEWSSTPHSVSAAWEVLV